MTYEDTYIDERVLSAFMMTSIFDNTSQQWSDYYK